MENITLEPLGQQHPFYPVDLKMPGFVANDMTTVTLLLIFVGELIMVASLTNVLARRVRPDVTTGELWAATWFMICGFIHLFFEGEKVAFHPFVKIIANAGPPQVTFRTTMRRWRHERTSLASNGKSMPCRITAT
jgi:hypothetical protein